MTTSQPSVNQPSLSPTGSAPPLARPSKLATIAIILALAGIAVFSTGAWMTWSSFHKSNTLSTALANAAISVQSLHDVAIGGHNDVAPYVTSLTSALATIGDGLPQLAAPALAQVQAWAPVLAARATSASAPSRLRDLRAAWSIDDADLSRQSILNQPDWTTVMAPVRSLFAALDPDRSSPVASASIWSAAAASLTTLSSRVASGQQPGFPSAAAPAFVDWVGKVQQVADVLSAQSASLEASGSSDWPANFDAAAAPLLSALSARVTSRPPLPSWQPGLAIFGAILLFIAMLIPLSESSSQTRAVAYYRARAARARSAIESLNRMGAVLRQALDEHGEASLRARLDESASSPGLPLALQVNRLLSMRSMFLGELLDHADRFDALFTDLRPLLGTLRVSIHAQSEESEVAANDVLARSQALGSLVRAMDAARASTNRLSEGFARARSAVIEVLWKNEAGRTQAQEIAKRVKRVAESAQSIAAAVDQVRQVGRRIQVLSFSTAIDAGQATGTSALSQEILRLAKGLEQQTLRDVEAVVRNVEEDAKAALELVDPVIADVVESNNRSNHAAGFVQSVEGHATAIESGIDNASMTLANALNGVSDDAEHLASIRTRALSMKEAFDHLEDWSTRLRRIHSKMMDSLEQRQSIGPVVPLPVDTV